MTRPRQKPTPASEATPSLWNPRDHVSLKTTVSLKNQTSQAPALVGLGHITRWLDQGITLELPPKACARGHHFEGLLEVVHSEDKDAFRLEFTARVAQTTALESGIEVELEFIQFSETNWDQILALFEQRQEEILQFLLQARGA